MFIRVRDIEGYIQFINVNKIYRISQWRNFANNTVDKSICDIEFSVKYESKFRNMLVYGRADDLIDYINDKINQ